MKLFGRKFGKVLFLGIITGMVFVGFFYVLYNPESDESLYNVPHDVDKVWTEKQEAKSTGLTRVMASAPVNVLNKMEESRHLVVNKTREPELPILVWWAKVSGSKDHTAQCGSVQCTVSSNQSLLGHPNTQAFLFYASQIIPYRLPLPRKQNTLWALMHEESPKNADAMFNFDETLSLFNLTSTFKRESDYPIPLHFLPSLEWLENQKFMVSVQQKNKLRQQGLAPVMYVQSDCGAPSDRDTYVKLLQKFITVDSYGPCLNNKEFPKTLKFNRSMTPMHSDEYFEFSARYKFVLAMENAVCDDYMTEKLWRPLNIGAVPIVWGSPRVKDFLPSNTSALVVNDFATVEELANFIKYLDSNDEEYKKFLTFKKRGGITNEFLLTHLRNRDWGNRMYPSQRTKPYYSFFPGFECFICQKVHTINEKLERGEKVPNYQASLSHYGCPVPKKFNDVGKATGNSENWIRAWRSGQNMGIAMKHFYSQNITVSRNIYDDYWKKLKNEDKTNNFLQKQMEQ